MVYTIFAALNSIYAAFYIRKNLYLFIIAFFFVLLIQPYFQKLTDLTLYGEHFHDINFTRIKTNLVYIVTFTFLLLMNHKVKLKKDAILVILFLLFLSMVNVLFSIDMLRSFWITLISIVTPILFYILLSSFNAKYYVNEQSIYKVFLYIAGIFFILGFYYYINVGLKGINGLYIRSGGSIYLSNYGAQLSMLFFPIVLFSKFKIRFEKIIKTIFIILFLLALTIALSRTAFVVYFAISTLIILKHYKKNRFLIVFFITIMLVMLVIFIQMYLNINLQLLLEERLYRNGEGIIASIQNDARFIIIMHTLEVVSNNILTGIGVSNYFLISPEKVSNSHNIFFNILVERGIFFLLFFISFIFYTISGLNKCKKYKKNTQIYTLLAYGILGFLIIGLTGNDIVLVSGYVNAWPTYFLVLIFVIQQKCNIFYKNKSKPHD